MIISIFIHVAANDIISFFILWLSNIPVCVCVCVCVSQLFYLIHLSVDI